jgi:hypothetical protein
MINLCGKDPDPIGIFYKKSLRIKGRKPALYFS